jgi:sugar/nucleoside kinase (ribokinase family)
MTATRHDVVAIGNAIVDIIGRCDDAFLGRNGLAKGGMALVDEATVARLYAGLSGTVEMSGGSAANTAVGVASFGGKAAFVGKIADDAFGRTFAADIRKAGVTFNNAPIAAGPDGPGTSRSLILVTPDGERTMNTLLGISTAFTEADLTPDIVGSAAVTYLEGYLFDTDAGKAAFRRAAALARASGRQVALTLSDGFCVDRHRADFLAFIRTNVDLLFANESELCALYETKAFDAAVLRVAADCRHVAVTRSEKGAVVVDGGQATPVPVAPVPKLVDTTGAGDLFAAGYLYGHTRGKPPVECARIGGLAAGHVIQHVGARPAKALSQLLAA